MAAITTSDINNNPLASHEDRVLAASIAISTLRALGRADLIAHLMIEWSTRFTCAMGKACYLNVTELIGPRLHKSDRKYVVDGKVARVRLSAILWPCATKEEQRETVIHEVCHLVTMHEAALQGRRSPQAHGYEWKATILRAGVRPSTYHNVDRTGLKGSRKSTKTETAHCKCRGHEITKSMASKIAKGVPYLCRSCHTNLKSGPRPATPKAVTLPTVLGGFTIPAPATMGF